MPQMSIYPKEIFLQCEPHVLLNINFNSFLTLYLCCLLDLSTYWHTHKCYCTSKIGKDPWRCNQGNDEENASWNTSAWRRGGWGETSSASTITWLVITERRVLVSFFQVKSDRMQGNSLKRMFRQDISNNFFMERVVKHCNRLPREVV